MELVRITPAKFLLGVIYMEKLFTTKEVSEIFSLKVITITEWIRLGKLKAIKFGKEYRILESDLNEFIQSKRT